MICRLLPFALLVGLCAAPVVAHAADVTIYRCTDARGKLTLRDSPCKPGEKQRTQTMLRPRDAAPTAPRAPATPIAAAPVVRYVLQPASRPLYQCVAADGRRYTSESAEGNPRWVPSWAGDVYAGYPVPYPPTIARSGVELRYRDRHTSVRIGGERQYIAGAPVIGYPAVPVMAAGGMWVRDPCQPMSDGDICAQLSERRHAINRRYVQAMPSERAELDRESAAIDARQRETCRR